MTTPARPDIRPANPHFSSGPCAKRPGWSPEVLSGALVGRSHRASDGKARLKAVIEKSREILRIPADYRVGVMPGSNTGAFEAAMWSLLGARGTDILAWESFGKTWAKDAVDQLKLEDVNVYEADYGQLPDVTQVSFDRDVVFTWNGTTSGVRIPSADWITDNREGLTICDATSAVFAQELDWSKLDVTTWSWQKVLGGEAQHGMIALSPRAVERLESYTPPWPVPKLFRLTKAGALIDGIFEGATINTPSMLCVEDHLDGLAWAERIGGLPALIDRANTNLGVIKDWVSRAEWVDFLAEAPSVRSNTSVCLKIVDPEVADMEAASRDAVARDIAALLAEEGVAYDISSHRDAPAGLRIWTGATVEKADLEALTPWLDWAFATVKQRHKEAA
ncbi:phosphoserine transaminase [Dichotomicrobium thermohalophilum]|uniref:phosphoserine transaminase n=1 Tax=Dichotomicrobium thermohalophilum TaxID=933063 RepID=A0A397PFK2_9HYPH|nr:phosphoserine transaminase [Dichotomicrobium thermohalophilum]RIA47738.1 phosphoserine aminotransferase [Dichotomicrobium thermohalophilum]